MRSGEKTYRKSDHDAVLASSGLAQGVRWMIDHVLNDPSSLRLVRLPTPYGPIRRGYHCHVTWELLCPLEGELAFECQGAPAQRYPPGTLLLVPPESLHMAVHKLEQPDDLRILVLILPGEEDSHGGISIGGPVTRQWNVLTPRQQDRWEKLVGARPIDLLCHVEQALGEADAWSGERAVALLRLLVAAFMEVIGDPMLDLRTRSEQYHRVILSILQTEYFNTGLDAERVAATVGLSPSHVRRLFKASTGKTLHQALLAIRLRRAAELLRETQRPVKEVAFLTGWSNQLYFSAAFRKHFGTSPSEFRIQSDGR